MQNIFNFFKNLLTSNNDAKDSVRVAAVDFPSHLYVPANGESVDIRNVASLIAGEEFELLRYECPKGASTNFISYAIFNDALLFADVEFIPTVNGVRILPFHGNPAENYKLALGVAPDISNASSIPCLVSLNPGDILRVVARNNALVSTIMGFRFSGYQLTGANRKNARVGG